MMHSMELRIAHDRVHCFCDLLQRLKLFKSNAATYSLWESVNLAYTKDNVRTRLLRKKKLWELRR